MEGSPLEDYIAMTATEDYLEAHEIEAKRQQLVEAYGIESQDALGRAIGMYAMANEGRYPGGEECGYEAAKQARRWLGFRGAYVANLKQVYRSLDNDERYNDHGLERSYSSYKDKLASLQEQQEHATLASSHEADPYYIATFAFLEAERIRRQAHGEIMLDPLQLEEQYAITTLRTILDAVLDSPWAKGPRHDRIYDSALFVSPGAVDSYTVRCLRNPCLTVYRIIEKQRQPVTADTTDSMTDEEITEYALLFKPDEVVFGGKGVDGILNPDACTALDLASSISARS